MSRKYYINQWDDWVQLCEEAHEDPHEIADFGNDLGGGDCETFIYCGEYPEKEG